MFREAEEGAIQSDAYIDALLSGHARLPVALPVAGAAPAHSVRRVIRTLERGMPRFHPSFLFVDRLDDQLRALADWLHAVYQPGTLVYPDWCENIGDSRAYGL